MYYKNKVEIFKGNNKNKNRQNMVLAYKVVRYKFKADGWFNTVGMLSKENA